MTALAAPVVEVCPVAGCGADVVADAHGLACGRHWLWVPRNVRHLLDRATRYGSVPEHRKAVDRAVRSLHAAVANRERQLAEQKARMEAGILAGLRGQS